MHFERLSKQTESVNKAKRELQAQLSQQIKKTAQAEKEKLRAMTLAGKEQVFCRAAEKAARAAEKGASAAERRAEAAVAKADTLRKAIDAERKAASRETKARDQRASVAADDIEDG